MPHFGNKLFDSPLKSYLIVSTPITSIFCIIPFELYYTGREYWNWNYEIPILFALTGVVIYALIIALVSILLHTRPNIASYLSNGLFFLGLMVLLADIFAPLQTSLLDGRELYSDEPFKFTAVEAVLFLMILIAALKSDKRFRDLFACGGSIALILISFIYLGLILISGNPTAHRENGNPTDENLSGNVYHIVLDEMQTDAAILFLQEKNNRNPFTGFTLFENNTANYLYTSASFPSYMTGTLYKDGKFTAWQEKFRNEGLLRHVFEKGYQITFYSPRKSWCTDLMTKCLSLDDIYDSHSGIANAQYKDFIQIWFARLFPNFLTNKALSAGKKLAGFLTGTFSTATDEKIPLSISEGKEPFSSVQMLRGLISSEKNRPDRGQYIYAHAILPHGPYVMDKNGQFIPEIKKGGTGGYFEQVECAFTLLIDFLAELKRIGRYESSTIIIHSDTGHGHRGFIYRDGDTLTGSIEMPEGRSQKPVLNNELGWNKDQLLSRTMSLMMIKAPFQGDELFFSPKRTQLIDLYPTITDLLQLEPPAEKIDGVSVFKQNFPASRQAKFYLFPPGSKNPEMIRVDISKPENLSRSNLVIAGSIKRHDTIDFPSEGLTFPIGNDDLGRVKLTGFSSSEMNRKPGNTFSWRWAIGVHGKIAVRDVHLDNEKELKVHFTVKPFVVNIDEKMIVKTGLSQAEIILKKGWNDYTVPLTFSSGKALEIEIKYKKSASPKSLGINEDHRNLSVSWNEISITN